MRILADQNVHRRVVDKLREAGLDVEFILETMPGRLDEEILARPDIADLIMITGDKGFGDWLFNKRLSPPRTLLLSRLPHPEWQATADRLVALLEQGVPAGQMITITKDGERSKPLPIGAHNA